MKRKFVTLGMGLLLLSALLVSCKKSDADIRKHASGTFHAFEAFINGKDFTLPTKDEAFDIEINMSNESEATITLIYYAKGKPQKLDPIPCVFQTDEDGFGVLKEKASGKVLVLYYDADTIDFYFPAGHGDTVSASRDGKKPGWWDED
ncbi:hypothetical protein [Niabella ginsenosidivorans]|nr:hypothetical protein [Niabella ginsenosidivorans]